MAQASAGGRIWRCRMWSRRLGRIQGLVVDIGCVAEDRSSTHLVPVHDFTNPSCSSPVQSLIVHQPIFFQSSHGSLTNLFPVQSWVMWQVPVWDEILELTKLNPHNFYWENRLNHILKRDWQLGSSQIWDQDWIYHYVINCRKQFSQWDGSSRLCFFRGLMCQIWLQFFLLFSHSSESFSRGTVAIGTLLCFFCFVGNGKTNRN